MASYIRGESVHFPRAARISRRGAIAGAALGVAAVSLPRLAGAAAPQSQLTWGVHISLAPTWFDPAETPGIITPFMVMYALHDAMLKPLPGDMASPCLAEPVTAAAASLPYDSVTRQAV